LKRLDRFCQFAVVGAHKAIQQSGMDFTQGDPYRYGVVIGSGIGGLSEIEEQHSKLFDRGPSRVSAFMIPKLMVNAASGNVSVRWGLKGPSSAVATACASATNAMGDAFKLIQNDMADVIVAGGSEAAITPMGLSGFARMNALSTRNDEPERASRPFDRDRDGFVLSEGAGIVVLEEYEHAMRRGAPILAEIFGYGMSADASHMTAPDPEGQGAARAMHGALRDAKLNPDDVDYVNAHGTSTPLGDVAETAAIKTVFGAHAKNLAVSSTKSQLGHLLGASGGVEFVVCALALQDQVAPPTINLDNQDPACDLNYVPHEPPASASAATTRASSSAKPRRFQSASRMSGAGRGWTNQRGIPAVNSAWGFAKPPDLAGGSVVHWGGFRINCRWRRRCPTRLRSTYRPLRLPWR
jgi:3-oxoacyl-[acyl-carrier-protein] synthase II